MIEHVPVLHLFFIRPCYSLVRTGLTSLNFYSLRYVQYTHVDVTVYELSSNILVHNLEELEPMM